MKINKCRICASKKFSVLFSLGNLNFTGKFTKSIKLNTPKDFLNLVMCKKCKLVQLDRSFNPNYLYSNDYGYRTGINKTMTKHVGAVSKEAVKIAKPLKNDFVLDIASNDATLLNFYNKKLITVGVDPLIRKHKKFYNKINYKLSDFFSFNLLKKNKLNKKFKIITALSMFYDLKNPDTFIKDIVKILHKNGVFILEHADLLSIIKNCLFDTICHEHLEYYSSKIIIDLMKMNNLRVFNIKPNSINGGSMRYFICHDNSNFKTNKKIISSILNQERKYKLVSINTYYKFFKRINLIKIKLNKFLKKITNKNLIIHGYGASTKGNVLLQYFGLDNKLIPYIAERNPQKYNSYTPGTKIKIVSENFSRKMSPNYYLVLPWHFKNEILKRENKIRKKGTKFIFPLPQLKIL
jgi:NDP-4-keto-2,6-dideoxyhexose 3-C-methyltransferase